MSAPMAPPPAPPVPPSASGNFQEAPPPPPPTQAAAPPPLPSIPAAPPAPAAPTQLAPVQPEQMGIAPVQPHQTGLTAAPEIDWDRMTVSEIAKAMGMEGLDFDRFGVTPIVALDKGSFKVNDGRNFGSEFFCRIQETKPKFVYKPNIPDNDPRMKVHYSYDEKTVNGKELSAILQDWASQGLSYERKQYLEAVCVLDDGDVVLLSVPPTSISRMSSFVQRCILSRKLLPQVRCRVGIAPEVTKAARPFTPISFDPA